MYTNIKKCTKCNKCNRKDQTVMGQTNKTWTDVHGQIHTVGDEVDVFEGAIYDMEQIIEDELVLKQLRVKVFYPYFKKYSSSGLVDWDSIPTKPIINKRGQVSLEEYLIIFNGLRKWKSGYFSEYSWSRQLKIIKTLQKIVYVMDIKVTNYKG